MIIFYVILKSLSMTNTEESCNYLCQAEHSQVIQIPTMTQEVHGSQTQLMLKQDMALSLNSIL